MYNPLLYGNFVILGHPMKIRLLNQILCKFAMVEITHLMMMT